jgi:hypothetical protein
MATKLASPSSADILRLLGDVDDEIITEILALRPSFAELEEAALWINGYNDPENNRLPPSGVAAKIVELIPVEDDDRNEHRT